MTLLIRIANAFFAALFLVASIVALGSLHSPGWAGLSAAFALLCFVNLRAAGSRALIAANLAALLVAGSGLLVREPALQWAAGVSLIPFAATSLALMLRPNSA